MKSCWRYPGSKAKLLSVLMPFITQGLENKLGFCDAFLGGGTVLLAVASKYPNLSLYGNDKDPYISDFWSLMASGDITELQSLLETKPTAELYTQLRSIAPTNKVESAYRGIFFNRTSFSGDMRHKASMIGGKAQKSKYTVDCRYNAKKLIKQIEQISALLKGRLVVGNLDIIDYLNQSYLAKDCLIYSDPPYFHAGKLLYQFSMNHDKHESMANKFKTMNNWILSYDNCPEILDLYKDCNINSIDVNYCIRGSKTSWHKDKELLILPNRA